MSLNQSKNRLFVVQEMRLNDGYSLFWFRDEKQITHEGLSYFQFTKDKCSLSPKSANGYCNQPVQIFDIKEETVSILTYTDIVPIIPDRRFSLKAVIYSTGLYDLNKKPNKNEQFFLDSLCKSNPIK